MKHFKKCLSVENSILLNGVTLRAPKSLVYRGHIGCLVGGQTELSEFGSSVCEIKLIFVL